MLGVWIRCRTGSGPGVLPRHNNTSCSRHPGSDRPREVIVDSCCTELLVMFTLHTEREREREREREEGEGADM